MRISDWSADVCSSDLDVTRSARAMAVEIQKSLPDGTNIFVAFDDTVFIEAAIERVYWTLGEAIALVLVVIWLFLGSLRAALIQAVTVPVCLLAAFIPLLLRSEEHTSELQSLMRISYAVFCLKKKKKKNNQKKKRKQKKRITQNSYKLTETTRLQITKSEKELKYKHR